jgi:16S rRNA (adenine1518-N6/adenine1519-N6)-dimethyltransferase
MYNKRESITNVVEELMRKHSIRPAKQRGQNFLIDEEVYDKIIETASLKKSDVVLEIGPGLGTLTEYLSEKVKRVVAIEVDNNLAKLLRAKFHNRNVEVFNNDILALPVADLNVFYPYKVVANIPYNITSPIFRKFLVGDVQPITMTLLVQKEIGERITAEPGQMSILAISVQLYSDPKYIIKVPAQAFKPAPKVDSCLINLTNFRPFPYKDVAEKQFWKVVKIGFSSKRKKLSNNLSAGLKTSSTQINSILSQLKLKENVRAQELSLDDWHQLSKKVLDVIE